jgi:ATP phosphoribosyltransferase
MITLALAKGRILEEASPLLQRAGIVPLEDPQTTRRLIIGTSVPDLRVVVVRATDVATYVQYGAAELGVAGKDVLLEHGGAGLYQPVELGIGRTSAHSPQAKGRVERCFATAQDRLVKGLRLQRVQTLEDANDYL